MNLDIFARILSSKRYGPQMAAQRILYFPLLERLFWRYLISSAISSSYRITALMSIFFTSCDQYRFSSTVFPTQFCLCQLPAHFLRIFAVGARYTAGQNFFLTEDKDFLKLQVNHAIQTSQSTSVHRRLSAVQNVSYVVRLYLFVINCK